MRNLHRYSSVVLLLLINSPGFSAGVDLDRDFWQCTILVKDKLQWAAQSNYQKTALNTAIQACKSESKTPASCGIAGKTCQEFNAGRSDRPKWRCTAIDHPGDAWPGSFNVDRDAAALNAKAGCISESKLPDTCFINLVTCNLYIDGVKQ